MSKKISTQELHNILDSVTVEEIESRLTEQDLRYALQAMAEEIIQYRSGSLVARGAIINQLQHTVHRERSNYANAQRQLDILFRALEKHFPTSFQDKVDEAAAELISQKGDQRLFEAAAGLKQHKARKDQANANRTVTQQTA